MSEVAGRLAPQVGARCLMRAERRPGRADGRRARRPPGRVVVLGGGVVGTNAAPIALGMGAEVTVLDRAVATLRELDALFGGPSDASPRTPTNSSRPCWTPTSSSARCWSPGARAPKLVTDELVAQMQPGSRPRRHRHRPGRLLRAPAPTTHDDPTFTVHGVVFYCVANMPGAVPHTST